MNSVKINLNGREYEVPEGSTILEAAGLAGFDIPTLCHSENLKPFTSCFVCAVKVEGGKGNFVPSCATKVRDGMSVIVESEEIDKNRRTCLELLLSDHCGDCIPPCEKECPASIDIRGFLELVSEGREPEAAKLIREKAPFPGILGRVCPRPCESVCRRGGVDEPIAICQMKRYIADTEISRNGGALLPEPGKDSGKKVAVIGAGPAGMTAAWFLRLAGHSVTVFEAMEKTGGMLRYGIPFYRLPEEILESEFGAVEKLGAEVRCNTRIGKDIDILSLQKDYDALIITTGAWKPASVRTEGDDSPGVYSGIEYLKMEALCKAPDLGKKTVVVGGGNTAIDAARTALRKGSETVILYRRTEKEMPANDFEIEEARHEGIAMEFLAAPLKITPAANGLTVRCIRMKLGEPDPSGRRRPVPEEGSEFDIEASSLINAVGQAADPSAFADLGLEVTRWGTFKADQKSFMTSKPGVFTAGDSETGPDVAVRAVGNGRKAAFSVCQYLDGNEVTGPEELFNSSMGNNEDIDPSFFSRFPKNKRIKMPLISNEERSSSFKEVESGFLPAEAVKEAERCLKCGCDAAEDCRLRDYSGRYGADGSRYKGARRGVETDVSHEDIKVEFHKCISCGSCVRACAEIKGFNVFSFVNRGFVTRMRAPFGRSLVDTSCDGCGECVKVCPTAGVMSKQGR